MKLRGRTGTRLALLVVLVLIGGSFVHSSAQAAPFNGELVCRTAPPDSNPYSLSEDEVRAVVFRDWRYVYRWEKNPIKVTVSFGTHAPQDSDCVEKARTDIRVQFQTIANQTTMCFEISEGSGGDITIGFGVALKELDSKPTEQDRTNRLAQFDYHGFTKSFLVVDESYRKLERVVYRLVEGESAACRFVPTESYWMVGVPQGQEYDVARSLSRPGRKIQGSFAAGQLLPLIVRHLYAHPGSK